MASLSFVVPMYNEAEIIKGTIEFLASVASRLTDDYEIVVVDDASTDSSASIAKDMAKKNGRLRVICLQGNTRFAGALKKGLECVQKDVIIYTDADLGIGEDDINRALSCLENADIVNTCSRRQKGETLWRMITSVAYNFLVRSLFSLCVRDINSSFKVFKRCALQGIELTSTSPFIDAEILIKAKARGFRISQIPVDFEDRAGGRSSMGRASIIFATFRDILRFFLWSP